MYKNPYIKIQPKTNRPYTEILLIRHCHPDYKLEKNSEITLIEGQVGIKEIDGERLAKLLPGQQLVYEKATGTKLKREVDIMPYEAWRDGKMIFKDRTL